MKKTILALATLGVLAFGADYSAMSATELAASRGTVAVEDKAAFQAAMQSKMQTMTAEERQTFTQARTANPSTGSMGANSGAGAGSAGTSGGAGAGAGGSSGGKGNGKGGRN